MKSINKPTGEKDAPKRFNQEKGLAKKIKDWEKSGFKCPKVVFGKW